MHGWLEKVLNNVCMYVFMYVCVYVCMYVCTYECMCGCLYYPLLYMNVQSNCLCFVVDRSYVGLARSLGSMVILFPLTCFCRSLSVASVRVNVSTNADTVSIDTVGTDGSKFVLTVCASFSGRGLNGRTLSTYVCRSICM